MNSSPDIPNCFYRVSVKGICIKDEKVLLIKEPQKLTGFWELPGGGLDYGEDIHKGLEREVKEETGLTVIRISQRPVYTWTTQFPDKGFSSLVLAYHIELMDLDFTPSDECIEVSFFNQKELQTLNLHRQAEKLRDLFNPNDF